MPAVPPALAALLAALPIAASAVDPALLGCWRTQQVHATYTDGTTVESNSDCVTEFGPEVAHARCRTANGTSDTVLAYEIPSPGHLHWRPAVPAAASEAALRTNDVDYVVDGDFAVTTRSPTLPMGGKGPSPKQIQVLSMRVDAAQAAGGCQPREPSPLRIGKSPRSALALGLPAGWRAVLADPADVPALAQAVGTDFFLGAFQPRPATPASAQTSSPGGPMVIVLDVSRFGASPVRAPEFDALKKDLATRLPDATLTCDTPERACYLLRTAQGAVGYTELVRVAGRAAMVSAVGDRPGMLPAEALEHAVRAFAERLQRDNASPR